MNDWRELKTMVKALGDVVRLAIVYHLARQEEITVSVLTEMLGLSQPLASWHLRKLRRAGLISTRRAGRQVYCSLNHACYQDCLQRLRLLVDPSVELAELPSGDALMAEAAIDDV